MNTDARSNPRPDTPRWTWILVLAGLLAVFGPTFHDLLNGGLWATDQNSHGPIVLTVGLWLLYYRLSHLEPRLDVRPDPVSPLAGGLILAVGLLLYVVGRSQSVYLFEVGSLVPVLIGLTLLLLGGRALRAAWFAFFFLLFMVPLPGSVVDAVTQPLKIAVSWGAEHLLAAAGYPVARSGVVLHMGQYQLLVADACAGLNSLFTLEALGMLYLNVVRHSSTLRNIGIALFIVPVSYTANLIRVSILALVTYHFGDAAGQGFVHGFSGMVLFLTALLLIIFVDGLLRTGASVLDTGPKTSGAKPA